MLKILQRLLGFHSGGHTSEKGIREDEVPAILLMPGEMIIQKALEKR